MYPYMKVVRHVSESAERFSICFQVDLGASEECIWPVRRVYSAKMEGRRESGSKMEQSF